MSNRSTPLPVDIVELMEAEKLLPFIPRWNEQINPRYSIITVGLAINGILRGLQLRLHVSKRFPARDAMAQIEYSASRRDVVNLWRCEWRPFNTHVNGPNGPHGYELAEFREQSHHHMFSDNYIETDRRMIIRLKNARPIEPDPNTLSGFLDFVGNSFNIKDIQSIPLPDTPVDMFWN